MTSILRAARALAAAALLALPCVAAQAAEPLTPAEEAAVLSLARGTPTLARYWIDGIVPMQAAAEMLRRSALLVRCAPLSRRAFSYLDATHRTAVERVLAEQQSLRSEHLGPSDGPFRNRAWLAAFALRPGAERAALVASASGPHRELAQRAESEDRVIDEFAEFAEFSVDIVTGAGEPAAVIWLKGYFDLAGRLPALREAVRAAAPDHLADFDRVDGFDRVGPADGPWLAALGAKLAERHEALRAALLKAYPPAVRTAHEPVERFRAEVQTALIPGMASRELAEAANALYPVPAGAQDFIARDDIERPARAEVQRICPPPVRPAPSH
jgi:hypothetical protein